jgi:hypothetical protein
MLAIWILSVFYFALAAPVAVRETLEVRFDAVDAPKDELAVWDEQMDPNQASDSVSQIDTGSNPSEVDSDARSPAPPWNDLPYDVFNSNLDSDTEVESDNHNHNDNVGHNAAEGDGNDSDNHNANANADADAGHDSHRDDDNGYDGDDEKLTEAETPELMTDVEELLGPLMHRPRNSGSGAVGSERGVSGNRLHWGVRLWLFK